MSAPEGSEEEELIGDTLLADFYYQGTSNGPRARYLVKLGTDSMYYLLTGALHPWGWFTSAPAAHACGASLHEQHDVNGDGAPDIQLIERHCAGTGQHTVTIFRLTWNADGSAVVQRDTTFVRRVALLGYLGAFAEYPQSSWWHDVRVTLDDADDQVEFQGGLRAGDYFIDGIGNDSLYPARDTFTVTGGDSLWFQSTVVAAGQSQRPWYQRTAAMLTQFNFDRDRTPDDFRGAVNSRPGTQTQSALWTFPARAERYRVAGRVVAPFHRNMTNGVALDSRSLYVTSVDLDACFTVSGAQMRDSLLTFDGECSTAPGTREYRWTFGDGAAVEWTPDSAVVHHAYGAVGSYQAWLRVRSVGTTQPVDSTSRTLEISAILPLWVRILGRDWITTSGTYTWTSQPQDGVPPYNTYRWYYQQGGSEEYLDGTRPTYKRYVSASGKPFTFRLRHTVQDAAASQAEDTLWVDVVPEAGGYAAVGLLDVSGTCRALPLELRARQRAHATVARGGRWPVPCLATTP